MLTSSARFVSLTDSESSEGSYSMGVIYVHVCSFLCVCLSTYVSLQVSYHSRYLRNQFLQFNRNGRCSLKPYLCSLKKKNLNIEIFRSNIISLVIFHAVMDVLVDLDQSWQSSNSPVYLNTMFLSLMSNTRLYQDCIHVPKNVATTLTRML